MDGAASTPTTERRVSGRPQRESRQSAFFKPTQHETQRRRSTQPQEEKKDKDTESSQEADDAEWHTTGSKYRKRPNARFCHTLHVAPMSPMKSLESDASTTPLPPSSSLLVHGPPRPPHQYTPHAASRALTLDGNDPLMAACACICHS